MSVETRVYPDNAILPVIHLQSNEQAVEAAGVASDEGVGGVFIIDHKPSTKCNTDILLGAAKAVRESFPQLWVGVNCLEKDSVEALKTFGKEPWIQGIWNDNALRWASFARVDMNGLNALHTYGELINEQRELENASTVFFGGLAMKGPGYIEDPFAAAAYVEYAQRYVDVVTTSGPGTGHPSPMERLRQIKAAVEEGGKIAVASGVDAANLAGHLEFADYVLLASSIEREQWSGIISREKLRRVMYEYKLATDRELEAIANGL